MVDTDSVRTFVVEAVRIVAAGAVHKAGSGSGRMVNTGSDDP